MSDSSEIESDKLLPVPAFLRPGGRSNRQKCPTLLVAWLNDPGSHKDEHGPRQSDIPATPSESSLDSNDAEHAHGQN